MVEQSALPILLDRLYDAALDPLAWRRFLDSLADAYRGTARVFTRNKQHAVSQVSISATSGLARIALRSLSSAAEVESPLTDQAVDSAKPHQLYHCLESVLFADESFAALLRLTKVRDRGAFSKQEMSDWELMGPHLRRVIEIRIQSVHSRLGTESSLLALDALGIGLAIASHDGILLFASRIAEQIVARGDGLSVIQGRLHVAPAVRECFTSRLRRIATGSQARDTSGEVVALPRNYGGRPILALIMPHACGEFMPLLRSAVVLLTDPPRNVHVREKDLASVYGLTAAEGKLLRELVGGVQLADYAAAAGIARNTAKTYLHQIFAKTGQTRQTDLVREILSDPLLQIANDAVNAATPAQKHLRAINVFS